MTSGAEVILTREAGTLSENSHKHFCISVSKTPATDQINRFFRSLDETRGSNASSVILPLMSICIPGFLPADFPATDHRQPSSRFLQMGIKKEPHSITL